MQTFVVVLGKRLTTGLDARWDAMERCARKAHLWKIFGEILIVRGMAV
jgi:hypothetical protein